MLSPHEILRFLTYHPRDFESSRVLNIPKMRKAPTVDFHQPTIFATLGDLDAFSIDLINEILQYSDLSTISMFSLLNRQARIIAYESLPYKHLLLHAPHAPVAMIRTGVGSHFTVQEVFHVLCSPDCRICGNFGAFLWMPACIRCCFVCLRKTPELLPMSESHAKAVFGLTKKALAKVPIVVTIPGNYGSPRKEYRMRRRLLSVERALQVTTTTRSGARTRNAARLDDVTRFMVTIPFPYFDLTSHSTTQIGRACRGCKRAHDKSLTQMVSAEDCLALADRRDQTYTEMGFFEHLNNCVDAQRLLSHTSGSDWDAERKFHNNILLLHPTKITSLPDEIIAVE